MGLGGEAAEQPPGRIQARLPRAWGSRLLPDPSHSHRYRQFFSWGRTGPCISSWRRVEGAFPEEPEKQVAQRWLQPATWFKVAHVFAGDSCKSPTPPPPHSAPSPCSEKPPPLPCLCLCQLTHMSQPPENLPGVSRATLRTSTAGRDGSQSRGFAAVSGLCHAGLDSLAQLNVV